jgi:hypothetical protein
LDSLGTNAERDESKRQWDMKREKFRKKEEKMK